MIRPKLMYASDKAVKDALLKRKFTNAELRKLFLSRGILASPETSREDLALYFSRLTHDYYDHQLIGSLIGTIYRKEKTSITYIPNNIPEDRVETVLLKVADKLQSEGDTAVVNRRADEKGFEIKIDYTQVDYGKTEFSQITHKDASIKIEKKDGGYFIRWPLNDYIKDIKEEVIDRLNKIQKDEGGIGVNEIELSDITDPQARTHFFTQLINLMEDFIVHDVKDVYVYHPKIEDDSDEDLGVHISKAALKGENVLKADELLSLYDKGYYVYRIVWIAKTDTATPNHYEFEAQFADAENCKTFSYLIRGVYKVKESGGHTKHKKSVSVLTEPKLFKQIEEAAQKSLKKIRDNNTEGDVYETVKTKMVSAPL